MLQPDLVPNKVNAHTLRDFFQESFLIANGIARIGAILREAGAIGLVIDEHRGVDGANVLVCETPQHRPSTNASTEAMLYSSCPLVYGDASRGTTCRLGMFSHVWSNVPLNGTATHIEHSDTHGLRRRQIVRVLDVILKLVFSVLSVRFGVHRAPRISEAASESSIKGFKALCGSRRCPSALGTIFHCCTPTAVWVVEAIPLQLKVISPNEMYVQTAMAAGTNAFLSIAFRNCVNHPIHLRTIAPIVILLTISEWINIRV